ncbi:MAG: DsrE family protein [Acidithiobacillus sp.]|uniref:DsrE family protein n=1 Tax=Acidithiobacillus sp. TaxID=1872118 RepID=UPI0025BE1ECF|nr:DsrE family protein [Acidithiobacillus sp.]
MSSVRLSRLLTALALPLLLLGAAPAWANVSMLKDFDYAKPTFIHDHPFAIAHVVLQVSQDNPARWNLTLNNAQNLLNYFGQEKVQIVVVAFGPGIKMYLPSSPVASRIAAINAEGVEFDVCHNSMEQFKKKTGHLPPLDPSVVIVPAGIVRIMQLESHGFDYVKP